LYVDGPVSSSAYNPDVDTGAMRLRVMTSADIPAAMRLKELAGWNQTAADWRRFLERSSEGCFVAEVGAQVRGTVTTIAFEDRFAGIGMVLVDPEYRGRGFGTALLERAIHYLDELDLSALKLDATPQGKPLYEKLGFRSEYEIGRWTRRQPAGAAKPSLADVRESASPALLESICKFDRQVFGGDRSGLLMSLHEEAPELTLGILEDGTLAGYALGRRGSFADHLGPWMARDPDTARQLLEAFLAGSSRETLIADCLSAHPATGDLLKSFGFSYTRPLVRMFRGSNDYPGRPELLCAILGPEFG
jgi:ribosomal protein S18 acetylase RimI-like enzyme